jgi:hypothetical protein
MANIAIVVGRMKDAVSMQGLVEAATILQTCLASNIKDPSKTIQTLRNSSEITEFIESTPPPIALQLDCTWADLMLHTIPRKDGTEDCDVFVDPYVLYAVLVHHMQKDPEQDTDKVCSNCCTTDPRRRANRPFEACMYVSQLDCCSNCQLLHAPCNATSKSGTLLFCLPSINAC